MTRVTADADHLVSAIAIAAEEGRGGLDLHLKGETVRLDSCRIFEEANRRAAQLVVRGVSPGAPVAIAGPVRPDWVLWAWAVWLAGGSLVPVQVPLRAQAGEGLAHRFRALVHAAGCAYVVSAPEYVGQFPEHVTVLPWNEDCRTSRELPRVHADDAAVVQFTSGSTSAPKGVVLSHRAVRAQMAALRGRFGDHQDGVVPFGWVPLFHDLGLFHFMVAPVADFAWGHVLPTDLFARDPGRWLDLVGVVRATNLVSPMSAWAAALRSRRDRLEDVDLGSVTYACFAAEAVEPDFADQMISVAPLASLDPAAIASSYGLAEATLGVTTTAQGKRLRVESFDRDALATHATVRPAKYGQRIVSAGVPLHGARVRIVRHGQEVGPGSAGDIQVQTASAMDGYLVEGIVQPAGEWIDTGDVGFLYDGELFVSGRRKDMLIVLGQNYYPDDVEWAAARAAGVRKGRCVAFLNDQQDAVVVLVEPEVEADIAGLADRVRDAVASSVAAIPMEVFVVSRDCIAKTTSGKLRRSHMREQFLAGAVPTM